ERIGSSIPLQLAFDYKPSMGYTPIHEVSEGRNWRIKEFYWKLWFGDSETLPEIDIRDTFVGPEVTITTEAVERFCAVIGNQGEQFKSARNEHGRRRYPLVAGDACKAEARIASVVNSDSSKTAKVTGFVVRDGKPVIEVTPPFLYYGTFIDYQNTFEIIEEPEYVVKIGSAVDVGVLYSKEWFEWEDDSEPLKPDTTLISKVNSEYQYKAKAKATSSVGVEGNAYIRNQLKELVKVVATSKLDGNDYTLTSSAVSSSFIAPTTNEPYSKTSGDFNPIHINPYYSDYAVLPGTITHDIWSSAATRKYVENVVVQAGQNEYDVSLVGMALPDGRDQQLARRARLKPYSWCRTSAPNVYVFTGRGSQEPGMGMELYNNSPATRAIREAPDAHLLAVYGISIVDNRYMAMSYDTTDKDGNAKTLLLFADIDIRTPQYTFSHPNVSFSLPSSLKSLSSLPRSPLSRTRIKGARTRDYAFARHSPGEYSTLASIADVLAISALPDVVFYCGITVQRAVERDEHNHSNYAMCTVNPSRIGKSFSDAALGEVVDSVSHETNLLLEIIKFNVETTIRLRRRAPCLETLTNVLNHLKIKKIDIQQFTIGQVKEMLGEIITSCFEKAREKQKVEDYIKLERGFATIPHPDTDVPLHSRYPWAGAMSFCASLQEDQPTPSQPRPPLQQIHSQSHRQALRSHQGVYADDLRPNPLPLPRQGVDQLGTGQLGLSRTTTRADLLFTHYNFERLVELGPGPTLIKMATCTLKAKYEAVDGSTPAPAPPTLAPAAAPVVAAPVAPAGGAIATTPDGPLNADDTLRAIVAQKLKKKVNGVPIGKAIKDLVSGESTLQNEILGDLQLESSSALGQGEALPLDELGAVLSIGHTGALGKHMNGLASRVIGGKMPGGFNITAGNT
ncbi:3-oxoacyl-[acyl-carrier-protein] synthase, partial [Ceratobasidium sp. 423]